MEAPGQLPSLPSPKSGAAYNVYNLKVKPDFPTAQPVLVCYSQNRHIHL